MSRPLLIGWPNELVGGAGLYLLRIAREIQMFGGKIWIFDVEKGLLNTRLEADRRFISTPGLGWDIPPGCDALLSVGYATKIGNMIRLSSDCRLCLVSMHEHEMFSWHKYGFFYKKFSERTGLMMPRFIEPFRNREVSSIASGLSNNGALFHVCGYNFEFDKRMLGLKAPNFLPIPVPRYPVVATHGERAFVWLSRLTKDKLKPLYQLINKVALSTAKARMAIVGYGPEMENLRAYCRAKNVEADFPGVLEGADLQAYLKRQSPVCFGVGTSILELASMGFPSLVVSVYADQEGLDSKSYAWVYDLGDHDMAISSFTRKSMMSFNDVIELVDSGYRRIGDLCREHARVNFSAESSAAKIGDANRELWPSANEISAAINAPLSFRMARSIKKHFSN